MQNNENIIDDIKVKKKKKSKKGNSRKSNILLMFIFFIGFSILMYPFITQWYYRVESGKKIEKFEDEIKRLSPEEIEERINLAKAYNSTLDASKLSDPYSNEEKEKGIAEYARMLQIGELIGHIEIPKIDENLPIYAGTSEDILQKGAGHLEGSSLPVGGISTHAVITAHRGLPTAALFTKLDKLEKRDIFFVHNIQTVLAYEVDQILVVEPTDFAPILVQPGEDYVTLLTCTPYMINSHRLLVRGHRVEYTPLEKSRTVSKRRSFFRKYFYWLLLFFLLVLIIFLYNFKKYLDVRKKLQNLN